LGIDIFFDRDLFNHAGAMSFFFLLSLPPLFLLFVLGIDKFASTPGMLQIFMEFLEKIEIVGVTRKDLLRLGLLNPTIGIVSVLGVLGIIQLFWAGKGILESIQRGLAVVFSAPEKRTTLVDTIFTFSMLFGLVFILFAGAIINAIFTFIFPSIINYLQITGKYSSLLALFFQRITLLAVMTAAIFCLFYFIPLRRPKIKSALYGAILFSFSVWILQLIVTHFFSMIRYNIIYGMLGSLVLLTIWVYLACVIFFAVATSIYVHERFTSLVLNQAYNLIVSHKKMSKLYTILYGTPERALKQHTRQFSTKEIIFKESDDEREVFCLLTGTVGIYIETEGELKKLFDIKEKEIFGFMANILNTPYSVWAIAETDATVLVFPADTISDLIHSGGKFALMVSEIVSRRLQITIIQNKQLSTQTFIQKPY